MHNMLWGNGRKSSGICPRRPGKLLGSGDAGGGIPEVGMEKGHCSINGGGDGALKHVGCDQSKAVSGARTREVDLARGTLPQKFVTVGFRMASMLPQWLWPSGSGNHAKFLKQGNNKVRYVFRDACGIIV